MKKIMLAALLAASTIFGAGFGTASTDADVLLNNPFTGKQSRFIVATGTEVSAYYKAGNKLISNVKGAYNATTDGSSTTILSSLIMMVLAVPRSIAMFCVKENNPIPLI